MKTIILALVACILPVLAYAADAPAAPATGKYVPYTAQNFGFSVSVPETGTIAAPGSDGWDREAEVAFEWYGADTDPVKLIMARVDDAGAPLDDKSFKAFTDELLSYWSPSKPAAGAPGTNDTAATGNTSFEVLNTADNLQIGNRTWNLIEVKDKSDPKTTVYYSVFSTWDGSKIYTLTFYYLTPTMDQVQKFGTPVLLGFKVAK